MAPAKKEKARKATATSKAQDKNKTSSDVGTETGMAAAEETAVPPRRRTRSRVPGPANSLNVEEASSRPLRKAQEQAKKNQNGDSIPEPSLQSDDDQDMDFMEIDEAPTAVKSKMPTARGLKVGGQIKTKKMDASSVVPQPAMVVNQTAKTKGKTTSRGGTATSARRKTQRQVIEVKYPPAALNDSSSDEELDIEKDAEDDSREDDGESDNDTGDFSDAQFTVEQATVLAKPAKGKLTVSIPDDEEEMVYDDEVMKGSSPPPGSDAEPMHSDDSGSEPELVTTKASAMKPRAVPTPRKTSKTALVIPANVSKPKVPMPLKTPSKGNKAKKPSKREEVHHKEQPVILQKTAGSTAPALANIREWSAQATAVANKANKYNLNDQPPVLKAVLSRSILVAHKYVIFTTLYPSYATPASFMRNLFLQAAKDIARQDGGDDDTKKYAAEIFERFRTDSVFVQHLTDLPMTRITQFRAGSKSVAKTIIDMHYGFTPNLSRGEVKALATAELEGNKYVYERTASGAPDISTIYQHSAVKGVLQHWLFKKHGQMGKKLKRYFIALGQERSDGSEGVPANDGELSIPVVAAAAAALRSVLQDTQTFNKGGRFDVNVMEDEYGKHVRTLEAICEEKPSSFHRLMNKLFSFVSTGEGTSDILAFNFDGQDSAQENEQHQVQELETETEAKENEQNGTVAGANEQLHGRLIDGTSDDGAGNAAAEEKEEEEEE
ncbi:hypothetical protein V5O48_008492 [Marasmius crinis-equi]|uniref:DUF6532 domain-containing protein n=1 Tax=Marasmius crinis-equi TaxID=585013 RepID=A0ABR3FDS3_9AGAR